MKSKNAFTIIEMLIVICIITIILGFTMSFSGSRIQLLNSKNMKEEFITAYNDQLSMVMNSNYYEGKLYDKLTLKFDEGKTGFKYEYTNKTEYVDSGFVSILGVKIDNVSINSGTNNSRKKSGTIIFSPYQIGCTGTIKKIKISLNNGREFACFSIDKNVGRLSEIDCKIFNQTLSSNNNNEAPVRDHNN